MKVSEQASQQNMIGAAWRYLPKLKHNYRFSEKEILMLLGDMPKPTYSKGIREHSVKLNRDQMARISLLLGIQKALLLLFSGDKDRAFTWIDRENSLPPFFGKTPREFMTQGDYQQLYETRKMLDAWRS